MRIKNFLLLLLVPAICAALLALGAISYVTAARQATELAHGEAENVALDQSELIFSKLREAETALQVLVAQLELYQGQGMGREAMKLAVKGVAAASDDFFGVWALWKAQAYDGKDEQYRDDEELGNSEGRANAFWWRDEGKLMYDVSNDYDKEDYYIKPLEYNRLVIIPPYVDIDTPEHTVMSSVVAPIRGKDGAMGVAGVDIELSFIQGLVDKVQPYGSGYAMVISDTGLVVAGPEKHASDSLPQVQPQVQALMNGEHFSMEARSVKNGEAMLCFYTPVQLDAGLAPWYFMVGLPQAEIMAQARRILWIQSGVSLATLTLLVALVFFTAQKVSRALGRIAAYAKQVARGNYTVVSAKGSGRGGIRELSDLEGAIAGMVSALLAGMEQVEQRTQVASQEAERAMNATAEAKQAQQVSEMAQKSMLETARRVDAVARELRATSTRLDEKIVLAGRETDQQGSLMDETVQAITAMAESVAMVSSNAMDSAQAANQAYDRAQDGARLVTETIEAVDGIENDAQALGKQMEELAQRTESIDSILVMIRDVADQINLLALNAAIEAARAGEAGRGFAVVADEVRKLAEKTLQATKDVENSVHGIRASMRESAGSVGRTMETVRATTRMGHEARASLAEIVALVQGMSGRIGHIAGLCGEQGMVSTRLTNTVQELRTLSASVRDAMHQSLDAAASLQPQARELAVLVEKLTQ